LVRFKNSAAAFAAEFFVQPPPPKKKFGLWLYVRLTFDQFIFWPKLLSNAGFGIKNFKKFSGPHQREGATLSRTHSQLG